MTARSWFRTNAFGTSLCFFGGLFATIPALAWNAAGHRLIACIAWSQLDGKEQAEVGRLLQAHPDRIRWTRPADDSDRTAFIEASTWADEIRHDPRFYDETVDQPTPLLPGFTDMRRHRDWHYVNRPINETASNALRTGRIDRQLVALSRTLHSATGLTSERVYALPWLIHLVGDAHQPLHVGVYISPHGKRGKQEGSERIINPFRPGKRRTTLHAFWDDLPGPSWLRRKPLTDTCLALAALYPRPAPSAPTQWITESWQIAKASGYPADIENVPVISATLQHNASEIARRRIAEAGYRLADELHKMHNAHPKSPPD